VDPARGDWKRTHTIKEGSHGPISARKDGKELGKDQRRPRLRLHMRVRKGEGKGKKKVEGLTEKEKRGGDKARLGDQKAKRGQGKGGSEIINLQ